MNAVRASSIGKTRTCPHCKATILESASVCPACHHYLKFEPVNSSRQPVSTFSPLRVEGTIRHPRQGEPWEYCFVLAVQNDRGEEIARQVVGVGALQPNEGRTFTVSLEIFAPKNNVVESSDLK